MRGNCATKLSMCPLAFLYPGRENPQSHVIFARDQVEPVVNIQVLPVLLIEVELSMILPHRDATGGTYRDA